MQQRLRAPMYLKARVAASLAASLAAHCRICCTRPASQSKPQAAQASLPDARKWAGGQPGRSCRHQLRSFRQLPGRPSHAAHNSRRRCLAEASQRAGRLDGAAAGVHQAS